MSAPSPIALLQEKLDYFRQQEAIIADPEQKFALKKKIDECEAQIAKLANAPTSTNAAPTIAIAHLPPPASHFVARTAELAQLDAAWNDPTTTAISLVAFGGVGKSALVAHWLERMRDDGWRGATHVLGHSNGDPPRAIRASLRIRPSKRWCAIWPRTTPASASSPPARR